MGVPRNTEFRSPRPFSLDTNCKVGGPITTFRFSDSLGLTELSRAVPLRVLVDCSKREEAHGVGSSRGSRCGPDVPPVEL